MFESLVIEDDDIAGVELPFEHRRAGHSPILGHVFGTEKVSIRATTDPVDNVDDDELFVVVMWFRNNVFEGPKEVNPKCALWPPSAWRHQTEESVQKLDSLSILHELYARMLTLAWDSRPISDGDRFVSIQFKLTVVPPVPDDVPGALTVHRHITLIMAERPGIEVRVTKVLPKLLGKPDRPVAGQRIALRV